MSADPPFLTVGTEVSAKYKGAFCEAKIKKCNKTVKCKVSPKDGGPQISVTDDSVQGELKIGALVKIRQPDSGQLIDGNISRIIDSSVYTVVFDDGDIATLKRTQICLKGDKHFMESDTLDRLPLTNPEHFSTPVNILKPHSRRRRTGMHSSPRYDVMVIGGESDDSDDGSETASTSSRRISPRGSRSNVDLVGKVVSLEIGDRKRWCPGLVMKPSNHEIDMKHKAIVMVKSFKDGKISTLPEKQVKEFSKECVKNYSDDKLTRQAVDKAQKYLNTKELPSSWKREEILGTSPPSQAAAAVSGGVTSSQQSKQSSAASSAVSGSAQSSDTDSSSDGEEEEKSDMFIAQLYKFMDDRSTPINKPAQLYNRDVNLSKLYRKVRKYGGFTKVSAIGKWKDVANRLGFAGISAGTEMKLLYRRYLVAYEEFHRKMGDTHMFEGPRSQSRRPTAGGRNVLPPRDREALHLHSSSAGATSAASTPAAGEKESRSSASAKKESKESPASSDKDKRSSSTAASAAASSASSTSAKSSTPASSAAATVKSETASSSSSEEVLRRTPSRQASSSTKPLDSKDSAKKGGGRTDSPKPPSSPAAGARASRGRPGSAASKANIKVEKSAKLDLDSEPEKTPVLPSGTGRKSASPVPSSGSRPGSAKKSTPKPVEEVDMKVEDESVSDEECSTVSVEVEYPPGTKLKVRYGRARNIKIYDAKVMEVTVDENKHCIYSVHYAGWNVRYDEKISTDRIVGPAGKHEKKMMEIYKEGYLPGGRGKKKAPITAQSLNSASSTGSRTPEPQQSSSSTATVAVVPKVTPNISKPVQASKSKSNSSTVVTPTAAAVTAVTPGSVQNRTTRSSISDISLPLRPTRSKSTDSSLSSGLPNRKQRAKRGSIAETDIKQEPEDETTEEEYSVGGDDVETSGKPIGATDTDPTSTAESVQDTEAKSEVRAATPAMEQEAAGDDTSTASNERTPRRTARRQTSKHTASTTTSVSATSSLTQSSSTSAAAATACDAGPPSKRAKRVIDDTVTEEPPTIQPAMPGTMTPDVRNRMNDIIDSVAGGDITTNIDDVILEHDTVMSPEPAESDESNTDTSPPPPTKRKKIEKDDSSESVACEEAFVKIEPLKHKKPQANKPTDAEQTKQQSSDDECDNMQLPPLMGKKSENKGSRSPTHTDDSSRPDSGQSSNSDYQTTSTTSQPASKNATVEQQASNTTISDSNLSMLSEQASSSKPDPRVKPRTSARRQQAKRSPRPRHSGLEGAAEAADDAVSHPDNEVSQINSTASSPNKPVRNTSAAPKQPRPPKHNFKILEELSKIVDQEQRITYLVDMLAEIRSLYSDVKSNLASIERKRKRVRQRDREHPHNTSSNYY